MQSSSRDSCAQFRTVAMMLWRRRYVWNLQQMSVIVVMKTFAMRFQNDNCLPWVPCKECKISHWSSIYFMGCTLVPQCMHSILKRFGDESSSGSSWHERRLELCALRNMKYVTLTHSSTIYTSACLFISGGEQTVGTDRHALVPYIEFYCLCRVISF